jgi:hypothetical protein
MDSYGFLWVPKDLRIHLEIYLRFVQDSPKIAPIYVQDSLKIAPRHVQDMSKTASRLLQDMSKTCPRQSN